MSDDRFAWPARPDGGSQPDRSQTLTPQPGFTSWPNSGSLPEDADLLQLKVQQVLGSVYDVGDELGRGGSAVVYRATDRATGRVVALKVIRADQLKDAETLARFDREGALMQRLTHPHIVATYAIHRLPPTGVALALEYVGGGTLKQRVRREGRLPVSEVIRILCEVAEALDIAHAEGVVHRDIKPENIYLEAGTGRAKLGDFGIARAIGSTTLTLTGTAIGTPAYMSPEQIDGAHVDGRSDVYALGLVGWELLTGQQPWEGETLFSVIHKQKTEMLPRLTRLRPEVPSAIESAINDCLAKDPAGRCPSARKLRKALIAASESRVQQKPVVAAPTLHLPREVVAERASRGRPVHMRRMAIVVAVLLVATIGIRYALRNRGEALKYGESMATTQGSVPANVSPSNAQPQRSVPVATTSPGQGAAKLGAGETGNLQAPERATNGKSKQTPTTSPTPPRQVTPIIHETPPTNRTEPAVRLPAPDAPVLQRSYARSPDATTPIPNGHVIPTRAAGAAPLVIPGRSTGAVDTDSTPQLPARIPIEPSITKPQRATQRPVQRVGLPTAEASPPSPTTEEIRELGDNAINSLAHLVSAGEPSAWASLVIPSPAATDLADATRGVQTHVSVEGVQASSDGKGLRFTIRIVRDERFFKKTWKAMGSIAVSNTNGRTNPDGIMIETFVSQ